MYSLAALIKVPLPGTPIPATLQTFALLAGAGILGRWMSLQMIGWYLILGLCGAPFFAGGSGLTHLMGASGGYLIGFVLASLIVGFFTERATSASKRLLVYCAAAAAIYVPGLIHLKFVTGAAWGSVLTMGLVPFILFDLVKALAAGVGVQALAHLTKK